MDKIAKTAERIVPEDFQSLDEQLNYLRHLFAYNLAAGSLPSSGLVLEVGCGEGYGTNFLAKKIKKVIGLDVNQEVAAYAHDKYANDNCSFYGYDGCKIPYVDRYFDAVISFQTIEHVDDDINFVSEIHRVLKKGGRLILTTPNRAYRLKDGQAPWNKFHLREYHGSELKDLVGNFFASVELNGIRGYDEIQAIEKSRVAAGISKFSFLPGFIKKATPDFLKKILKPSKKITAESKAGPLKYGLNDFYTINKNIKEEALDLLILAEK